MAQSVSIDTNATTSGYSHGTTTPGCFAHDLLAFIYLVQPGLFTTTVKSVRVATDGLAQGQTIMNERDFIDYPQPGWEKIRPRTQVCKQVDAAGCLALFEETMLSDWLPA